MKSNTEPGIFTYNDGPLRQHLAFYDAWTRMVRSFLKLARVTITGLEELDKLNGGILAPNHLNWKDPFFVSAVIREPIRFVATYRLFEESLCIQMFDEYTSKITQNPWWLKNLHTFNERLANFTVKRIRFSGALPSALRNREYSLISSLKSLISSQKMICVFPEGRTSSNAKLNRLKLGLSRFLLDCYSESHTDIPVLPVGISGTDKAVKPGMKLGFHMGEPLYINDFFSSKTSRTLMQFTSVLQQRITDLMNR